MIIPPKLSPGDAVGIVAPGRKIAASQVEPAVQMLTAWGLEPILAPNLYSQRHSYLSGTDEERCRDFQQFLADPRIRAIICARGGYGSTRIIDGLDLGRLQDDPKWIVGFSDVTAFHLALARLEVVSIHGTMPVFFGLPEARASVESLRQVLFGTTPEISVTPHLSNRQGRAEGRVIGGNLSLLVDAIGTTSDPETRGAIVIIEEVDEYYYKVDRMLRQLRRSGKLAELAGLIVGHMTGIKNSDLPFGETIPEIVLNAVAGYDFPVAFGFPSGHENPNLAWLHGAGGSLEVGKDTVHLSYSGSLFQPSVRSERRMT